MEQLLAKPVITLAELRELKDAYNAEQEKKDLDTQLRRLEQDVVNIRRQVVEAAASGKTTCKVDIIHFYYRNGQRGDADVSKMRELVKDAFPGTKVYTQVDTDHPQSLIAVSGFVEIDWS